MHFAQQLNSRYDNNSLFNFTILTGSVIFYIRILCTIIINDYLFD